MMMYPEVQLTSLHRRLEVLYIPGRCRLPLC